MFDKTTEIGGAFKASEMVLTFAGFGAGYLITSLGANYNVTVTRFRELGSTRTYYVEGDSVGSLQLGQVIGPGSSLTPLVRAYSDVCSVASNVISLSFAGGKCAIGGGVDDLTFSGALLTQWGIQASTQGAMTTTGNLSGTYESLDTAEGASVSGVLNAASNVAGALGI